MPFDRVVVVIMENHSFDNLLGALHRTRADVDGLTFDGAGTATNANPGSGTPPATVAALPLMSTAQSTNITQNWRASHEQINGGAMDGFVRSSDAMSRGATARPRGCRSPTRSQSRYPRQPLVLLSALPRPTRPER